MTFVCEENELTVPQYISHISTHKYRILPETNIHLSLAYPQHENPQLILISNGVQCSPFDNVKC